MERSVGGQVEDFLGRPEDAGQARKKEWRVKGLERSGVRWLIRREIERGRVAPGEEGRRL